jgi:orotate phosphoribosyltransferase-like protein
VKIVYIKKEGESSHNNSSIIFDEDHKSIILDDFICSGTTINTIFNMVRKSHPNFSVDCLCLSGEVDEKVINFKVQNLICGSLTHS